jgi:acyl-coenzyme A synthetase/AMP-(fatty) acid ligase
VRLLPGGDVAYIGRVDKQVKINGYRVELGEIENALNAMSGIRQSAVMVDPDDTKGRPIAFLVSDENLDPPALREALGRVLPAYMIPRKWIRATALPVT